MRKHFFTRKTTAQSLLRLTTAPAWRSIDRNNTENPDSTVIVYHRRLVNTEHRPEVMMNGADNREIFIQRGGDFLRRGEKVCWNVIVESECCKC